MGVVVASELLSCAGRPLSSVAGMTAEVQPQVTDEEAVTDSFIPADAVSAVLISPRRVLVTGGVLADERVLPLTVVRFLDLDAGPRGEHAWTKPLQLRPTSKRGKRKRAESAFPYCRMEQTLTFVPECSSLFLIGGLKVGGKEEGKACKSMFSFHINSKLWDSVELAQTTKMEKEKHALGPRFAHTALYVPHVGSESRSSKARKSSGYILVFGGYVTTGDRMPCLSVHVFDVRTSRWSLREPAGNAVSPRRAYHAGVVTPSSRYFVVHGGQIAHFNESNFLSSDLFAFDILRSEWIRPRLSPSSSTPPTARRRHCMVNGIGKHEGAILLFGGELCSGQFSNELFVLRIKEPSTPAESLSVIWEKLDVRSPEALIPMPQEHLSQPEQPSQDERAKHAATAGGCLLAVPELNKYLVIGGRGANGIRSSPLLLEGSEVEKLDRLENILSRHAEQGRIPSIPVPQAGKSSTPLAEEVVAVRGRAGVEKKMAVSPAQAAWRRQKRDENIIPLDPSKVKLRVREHSLDDVISPDRKTAGAQRRSSLQPTRSDEAPSLAPSGATSAAKKKSQNGIKGAHDLRPATSVRPVPAIEVGGRGPVVESGELFLDLVDTDDDFDVRRVRDESPGDPQDLETPPTKRRRFINGRRQGDTSNPGNDGFGRGSENSGVPGSAGSGFVAASELARKAKSRVAKSARGRGRPRGGARRKRAETVAEEREVLKAKESEELLARKNVLLVKKLQSEKTELQQERDTIKKDNLELNGQMKSLLSEIQPLRAFRREHGHLKNASFPTRTKTKSSEHYDTSQDTGGIEPVGRASSRERGSGDSQSEELKMLHSKTADILEEYDEVVAERDELNKSLKDAEEGRRALEIELHHAKNKFERLETERDQLRKQTSELRTLATSVTVERDTATSQLRKAEEGNSVLKRELERLQDQLRDADSKRMEEKLRLSNAQRQVTTVKGQLNEVQKKYDHFDSKERRLKGELGSQQNKLSELQRLVDQESAEKQKIEERTIELVTELEVLKTDHEKTLRECQTAIKDAEKSRQALDRGKKEIANLDVEVTKLRRDLVRTQRDCNSLNLIMRRRHAVIHALQPALVHITNEIGVLAEADADDLGRAFRQTDRYAANGDVTKRTERIKTIDRENEGSAAALTVAGPNNNGVRHKTTSNSKKSQERSTPDGEDLKSPVPPSEEEEEP